MHDAADAEELRLLHWLEAHEAQHPDQPVKDTDVSQALGFDYTATHALLNGLKAGGCIEARDFYTHGLGYYIFGIRLTPAGKQRLAKAEGRPPAPRARARRERQR